MENDIIDTNIPIIKIIILGEACVGKTSIIKRYCTDDFQHTEPQTIGIDFITTRKEIGGQLLKINMWDTAGQERYRKSITPQYIRGSHGIIIAYDCTTIKTTEVIDESLEMVKSCESTKNVPIIILGNKCEISPEFEEIDLDHPDVQFDKVLSFEEICEKYVGDLNIIGICEVSAKTGHCVNDMVNKLVRQIRISSALNEHVPSISIQKMVDNKEKKKKCCSSKSN